MTTFSVVFLCALALATATRLWLGWRHVRYVQARRGEVPAEFAQHVTLAAHQRAADYTCAKTRLAPVAAAVEVALVLWLTFGGGLQALHGIASWLAGTGLVHGLVLISMVVVIVSAAELPLSLYRVFGIESRFGFNRMTPGLFFVDVAKNLGLAAALGLPLVAAVLWLMEKMGGYWWLYVWLVWVAFNLFLLTVYPTFIAPLFNKFTPLADEELKARIERLVARCGFKAQSLLVMDGSRRTTHGNAYFTGFGKSKRIVFFDTLLARLGPAEVEAVLAHELGHFKLRHVMKRVAWVFAVSLAFLWLLGYLMEKDWFYAGLNVASPSTAMALILFFLVMPVFTFLLQPLGAMYSRKHEFEADQYAARNASAADLVSALVKLYRDNASTLTPDPVHSAFYDSHPPAAIRIARLQKA